MALKLPKLFGEKPVALAEDDFDIPTTQVKMGAVAPAGYDPLASVSIMEQLRTAQATASAPRKLPVIGNLPMIKQEQMLGGLLVLFLALAGLMWWLDGRIATQQAAQGATATEMQMLSQRLARGSALAAQGQSAAFAAVRNSRDRFKADFDALVNGGTVRGVSIDVEHDPSIIAQLEAVKTRWERVDGAAQRLTSNEQSLTSLAKGLDAINQGNNALLELAQQASAQMAQSGASLRELDFANQLAVLSQRIAKNANALASSDEIDPEFAFLLGKDTGTFRDVLAGLLKGSDALRLPGVRGEDARSSLAELTKRFASYETGVNAILSNMPRLVIAKQAARSITNESEGLLNDTTKLADEYGAGSTTRTITSVAAIVFAVLALACLLLFGKLLRDDARARASESEHENKRNQEAILRLLNEMGNLADGDLTVQASVTEDVTGAIADSINFTI